MMDQTFTYSKKALLWMVGLRVIIGWHFLYEGMVKAASPNWSSAGYLMDSKGFLSGIFQSLASNADILNVVDILNIWGLIFIGAGLILGVFTQVSIWSAIVLLAFYYLAQPPFIGYQYSVPAEGSYLLVNKNLIELVALVILLFFPTGTYVGIDRLIFRSRLNND